MQFSFLSCPEMLVRNVRQRTNRHSWAELRRAGDAHGNSISVIRVP